MKSAGGGGQEAEAAVNPEGKPAWRAGGHWGAFLQRGYAEDQLCARGSVDSGRPDKEGYVRSANCSCEAKKLIVKTDPRQTNKRSPIWDISCEENKQGAETETWSQL